MATHKGVIRPADAMNMVTSILGVGVNVISEGMGMYINCESRFKSFQLQLNVSRHKSGRHVLRIAHLRLKPLLAIAALSFPRITGISSTPRSHLPTCGEDAMHRTALPLRLSDDHYVIGSTGQ